MGTRIPFLIERNRTSGLWHILLWRRYCQITEKLRRLVWKGGEYCLFQSIDKSGKMHYTSLKRYHCFSKTAHSRLSLSQFSVADTAGEPFLFSKATPHNCACESQPSFCPTSSVWKTRNTYSIPSFSKLWIGTKILAEPPCQIMRCCPKSGHFRYVLQNLLRRSAWMAGMLRLISGVGE